MTPEEKENMTLTIENAMLKGFEAFASKMDEKIKGDIESHKQGCELSRRRVISFADTIRDWKTIAAAVLALAWIFSSVVSTFSNKISSEQAQIIAKQFERIVLTDPNFRSLK
jgi:hypothetical protein